MFPYGLDAPPVVRNFALAAAAVLALQLLSNARLLPITIIGGEYPAFFLASGALGMIWSSRFGKVLRRNTLLAGLSWRGDEQVLDIGCGRGLYTVGAARRVPNGHVTGLDIWQAEDLSGNSMEAAQRNADKEGVAGRVSFLECDMRSIALPDASMDIIVSAWAVHNIYQADGRSAAISEIWRVLRPGGQVMIDDIRHITDYAGEWVSKGGTVRIRRDASGVFSTLMSFGSLRPAAMFARKP